MSDKLPAIKPRQLIRALECAGWEVDRVRGSHYIMAHPDRDREERARRLQLDLTAFPVFVEALPEEDRDAATVWMAERSFLGARGSLLRTRTTAARAS